MRISEWYLSRLPVGRRISRQDCMIAGSYLSKGISRIVGKDERFDDMMEREDY